MDGIKVEILENDDKHFPTLLHSPHTYLHSEFHIESSKKWLNGQFYALVSFSVNQWSKCIIYFYSIRDIQTIISLMVVLSPQQVTANTWESEYLNCRRTFQTLGSDSDQKRYLNHSLWSSFYLINWHIACPHRLQSHCHIILRPVNLGQGTI